MTPVLIALGSNVGDASAHIERAMLSLRSHLDVSSVSSLYRTAPMYVVDQDDFVNCALTAQTELAPHALVALLKRVEHEHGRESRQRNGPREIDLDLILYGCAQYRYRGPHGEVVEAPHPRMEERRFVLEPAAEIAGDWIVPGLGRLTDLLRRTEDQVDQVKKMDYAALPLHSH